MTVLHMYGAGPPCGPELHGPLLQQLLRQHYISQVRSPIRREISHRILLIKGTIISDSMILGPLRRNIRGFMLQGGDPTGTGDHHNHLRIRSLIGNLARTTIEGVLFAGRGGKSIYPSADGKFPDEISDNFKFAKRGVVAMANSGPDTNARCADPPRAQPCVSFTM